MPTTTFENLKQPKKQLVTAALLTEFSEHPLAEAQVARIVKTAHIARGAFYKYFADLTDAYQYLFKLAMIDIHQGIQLQFTRTFKAEAYYNYTETFLRNVYKNQYYQLIKLHFTCNEGLINGPSQFSLSPTNHISSPTNWAAMILCHATIRETLQHPEEKAFVLANLKTVLTKLAS